MKVRINNLIEINDADFERVPIMEFSRYMGKSAAYLCRVRNNQVVISEDMYKEIMRYLTEFVNDGRMDTVDN
jgi:hypothetical protein